MLDKVSFREERNSNQSFLPSIVNHMDMEQSSAERGGPSALSKISIAPSRERSKMRLMRKVNSKLSAKQDWNAGFSAMPEGLTFDQLGSMNRQSETKATKRAVATKLKVKEDYFYKFVQKNKALQQMNIKFSPFGHGQLEHYYMPVQVPSSNGSLMAP